MVNMRHSSLHFSRALAWMTQASGVSINWNDSNILELRNQVKSVLMNGQQTLFQVSAMLTVMPVSKTMQVSKELYILAKPRTQNVNSTSNTKHYSMLLPSAFATASSAL